MDPELPGGHQQGQREGEAGQQGERGVEYGQHLRIHTIRLTEYEVKTAITSPQVVSCSFVSATDI